MKAVRGLIRFALRRGLIDADPAQAYELPRGESEVVEVYSPEELELLYADPNSDMAEVWRFLCQTCLRISEFIWLTKNDVLFDAEGKPDSLRIRPKVCSQTGANWSPKHNINRIVALTE